MNKPWLLAFFPSQILYFPTHVCPVCGAKATTHKGGELFQQFLDIYGNNMEWDPYFGYLKFDCSCHLNMSSETDPHLAGEMRVARVGDAMLPVEFVSMYSANLAAWDRSAAEVNQARVRQAVQFLAANADQQVLTGSDALKVSVYAVSAGQSPEKAY